MTDSAKVERDVPGALVRPPPAREFPGRPAHHTPGWVKSGAIFHIRIRCAAGSAPPLTHPALAAEVLGAVRHYHETNRWYSQLFLLMPDHAHALLVFPPDSAMSNVIGAWKSFLVRAHGVRWQPNYFDHRIRHDDEFGEKWHYIRRNPVVKNLCVKEDDWPWVWLPSA
jgi:REP element-mobilizing transposase RayT